MSVSLLSLNIPSTKPPFLSLKQGRMPDNLKNEIQLTLIRSLKGLSPKLKCLVGVCIVLASMVPIDSAINNFSE